MEGKEGGKVLSSICYALLGVTLRSQPHCLLKSGIFHSALDVYRTFHAAEPARFSAALISPAVDPFLVHQTPFLYGNIHGSQLSGEVLIYLDWKIEIPVLSHFSPHCQLVLVWPDFLRKTCVRRACHTPQLRLAIFPFLFSQEVTSEPLGQISCIDRDWGSKSQHYYGPANFVKK